MPTGYEYREYKNWRGIPKPRRCPFRKQAKGEIRKIRGGFKVFARIVVRSAAARKLRRGAEGVEREGLKFLAQ